MNSFKNKISLYNKLNYNIQDIILSKLFKQQKKWNRNAIKASIKAYKKIIEKYKLFKNIGTTYKPSTIKNIEIIYKNNMKKYRNNI
jgi:hypothetical protein